MNTEYVFPKWFNFKEGFAFIYLFNTIMQLSKESPDELKELNDFYLNFPQNKPDDVNNLKDFKKKINSITNLCILCDGYDPSIDELNISYDKIMEYAS
jgi:hypothetical protein